MKINEIIRENTYHGWDDNRSESFPVRGTLRGVITIARSFDENNNLDSVMFNYYDIDMIGTTDTSVVGIRLDRDKHVKEFIYGVTGIDGATKDIGHISKFDNLYKYFMLQVVNFINTKNYLGENMNNRKKLTLDQFMSMNSEIVSAMKQAEKQYHESHTRKESASMLEPHSYEESKSTNKNTSLGEG